MYKVKRYVHGMLLCNNPPRAVQAYTWGEAANYKLGYGVKGCRYEHNQPTTQGTNPPGNVA